MCGFLDGLRLWGGSRFWTCGGGLGLSLSRACGGALLLASVVARDGFSFVLVYGTSGGGCGHRYRRALPRYSNLHKADRLLHPHILIAVFQQVLLYLCVGQTDTESIGHSLLPWFERKPQPVHALTNLHTSA